MSEYTGCPGCGEVEDKDCRCTGANYVEPLEDEVDYVVRDAEGRVVEIVTKDGHHILSADFDRNSVHDAAADDREPPRYEN